MELTIKKIKFMIRTSVVFFFSCFTNKEALESSSMETLRESLKMDSGSGRIEKLRGDDKLEKQESGSRVTLQMALIDAAESDAREADSAEQWWMAAPSRRPIVRVRRRAMERDTARRMDLRAGRGGCRPTGLTLP